MNISQHKKIKVTTASQLHEVLKENEPDLFYSIFDIDGNWIRHIINFYFDVNKKSIIKAAEESEYPDYESAEVMARKYGLTEWQVETQYITKIRSFLDDATNYQNAYFCKLVEKLINELKNYYEFTNNINFFDFIKDEFKEVAIKICDEYYEKAITLYNKHAHPTEYMLSLQASK